MGYIKHYLTFFFYLFNHHLPGIHNSDGTENFSSNVYLKNTPSFLSEMTQYLHLQFSNIKQVEFQFSVSPEV